VPYLPLSLWVKGTLEAASFPVGISTATIQQVAIIVTMNLCRMDQILTYSEFTSYDMSKLAHHVIDSVQ
jgi:hypothetical protein